MKESERQPTEVYTSLFVLFQSLSPLFLLSPRMWVSLSLALFVCVCTHVGMYSYVVLLNDTSVDKLIERIVFPEGCVTPFLLQYQFTIRGQVFLKLLLSGVRV